MTDSTELKKQQYQRLNEIFAIARQRYLDDGGDPQQSSGSHKGKDYLTEQEKQEIRYLGDRVFGPVPPESRSRSEKVG
ncbi:MAG: hypothetical protein KME17_27635 [Cyanosarcina radialis HA8281-LM2]|jgi:hypothetical protein|nr:hypothetical protein [Cyanosarcina radialis HA8281-LM2]